MRKLVPVLLLLVVCAVPLVAHDFWLASSAWQTAPGSTVTLTANVGDRFPAASSYTDPARVDSVTLIGPDGRSAVQPDFHRERDSLATDLRLPATPGPTRLRRGDTLAVQLLVDGQPVAGALIGAIDAGSKGAPDDCTRN